MSELKVSPNCLLFYIDETGHETFANTHPVFGMGGCAELACNYEANIKTPWLQLKSQFFGDSNAILHAADLGKISLEQKIAFCEFFHENLFSRVYTTVSVASTKPDEIEPYHLIARCLLERMTKVAAYYPFDSIAIIFESSERLDKLAAKYFSEYSFSENGKTIPIEYRRMPKHTREAGLEVADFIIHTAGGQARHKMDGKVGFRKDYECIFQKIPSHLASGLDIDSVISSQED